MRFVHTADWHLGRTFHEAQLTEDQAHVLDQLVGLVKESRADAVLVAGDVYERAVPPPEAVKLLDDVLSRLVLGLGVPVVLIAGNHDSPDRLGFASGILAGRGLHVVGSLAGGLASVPLADEHGPVRVHALPFAEPAAVRAHLGSDEIRDHAAAMRSLVERIRQSRSAAAERSVLVAHAFVVGGDPSESERPLSIGGAGTVDVACFEGFDYVALGHLHRAQSAAERVQYSGSLLKYSFSEVSHVKGVNLIEMDAAGGCRVERIALRPRRDARRIEGTLDEILRGPSTGESRDDYLAVKLLDRGPILDPMGKLRAVYPNVLHIEPPELSSPGELRPAGGDHRRLTDADLFASFFRQVTQEDLTEAEACAYASVVEDLRRREREESTP